MRLEDVGEDRERASAARPEAELAAVESLDREIVVLGAESVETLHRTHAYYFVRPEPIAANFATTLRPGVDEPSPEAVTETLDQILGADGRAELGRSQARSGHTIPLQKLNGGGFDE